MSTLIPMTKRLPGAVAALAAGMVMLPGVAMAAGAGGGGSMPWNSFLTTLKNDLTGPTAGIVALIAFFALAFQLAWGGEMSDLTRRLVILGMIVSFLVGGSSTLSAMGITGAVV